eukprot:734700_1
MGCCLSSAKPDEDLELDKDLMALEEANGGTGDPPENFVDNVKFGFANLMDDVRSGFSKVKNFDRIKSGADKFFDKDRTYNQRMPLVVALLLCIIVTLAVLYGSAYAVHGLSGSQSQQTNNVDYEAITETSTSYSNAPPTKKSSEATSVEINQSNGISTGLAFTQGGSNSATPKRQTEMNGAPYVQLTDNESADSNHSGGNSANHDKLTGRGPQTFTDKTNNESNKDDGSDTGPSFSFSRDNVDNTFNTVDIYANNDEEFKEDEGQNDTRLAQEQKKKQEELRIAKEEQIAAEKRHQEKVAQRIKEEHAGGNSLNEKEDARLTSRTTPNKMDNERKQNDRSDTDPSVSVSRDNVDKETKSNKHAAMEPKSDATPVNSNTHATDNTETQLASHSNDSPIVDHLNEEQNDNKPGEETKSNKKAAMESKSDATPVNSNTHATDNTETQLASHSNDSPMVDHLNEEQNDNKPGEETKSNSNVDMEPKSDATPVNSNAINTVITGPPLTSHFYDAPQVGHPDEEQKDNKHGEKLLQEEQRTDDELAGDVSDTCLIPSITHDTAVNTINTSTIQSSQTLVSNIHDLSDFANQQPMENDQGSTNTFNIGKAQTSVTNNKECKEDDVHTDNLLGQQQKTTHQDTIAAANTVRPLIPHSSNAPNDNYLNQLEEQTDKEQGGESNQNDGNAASQSSSFTSDTDDNTIKPANIQTSQSLVSSIDCLSYFVDQQQNLMENDQDSANAAITEQLSAQSTNNVQLTHNLDHEENVRKQGSINASDSKKSQTSLVTNNEDWNEVGRDNTHFVEQQKKIHQVLDSRFELKVDANGNQIPRGDGCPLVELNNDLQDNNQSSRSLTNELDNATTLSVNMASTDNQRGSNNTLESADSTNALNNVEEDRKESDSTTYEDVLTDDLFYTNSNDGDQGASGFSKSDLDAKVSESKERLLDGIRTYRQKKRIVDERQLVKYNPQIHSPESKERRIMLDRFHAYNQKTHYSNLDPRIMSFLNTSSKNIANQFQTVKYNSPIRRVSHTPESKERRIMLDRVQSYYQKTHFADDYHNDTSNTNDVVFPRFSILQDNSQEGMCFVILYPSASHDSVDNYQILSGVQDVVTESFDARSIQDTTIFPAKVISNTYPKSLILRATLKDGSCIDSGVPLPPPSVAFTLKMGTDNSDTVLDLRRAVGITDDEATEYQLSVGPDRDDMSGIIHQFTGKVAHEKNGMLKVDSTNLQGAKVGRIRAIKYIGGRNGNRVISDSFTEIKSDEVSTGHDDDDYEDDVDDDDDNKRSDHDDEHDKRDGEEDDEGGDDDEERVEADGNYDDNDDNNGGEASKDDNVPESHQDGGGGSGDGNEHGVSINDVSESHEHGRGGSGYGSKHGASINDGFDDGKECDTSNFKGSLDGKENESYKGQYVSDDNHVPNKKHNDNDIQHDPTKSTSIANGSNKYDEKEDRVMVGDESKYNESDQHQDAVVESQEDEKNESVRTHKHGEDTKDGEQGIKAAAVVLEDAKGSFTLTKDSEHSGNKGNPVGSNIYERHLRIPRKNLPDQGSINLILEAKNSRSIEFREFIVNG